MRRALVLLLVAASFPLVQGCCLGTVSRFDGEWPFPPSSETRTRWDEAAAGDGGALLVERGSKHHYLAVTKHGSHSFELDAPVDLAGAQVHEGRLYRITPDAIVRSSLMAPLHAETVAKIESARAFAVSGDELVVARPGAVYAVHGSDARAIWQGEAIAVAIDPARHAAWIVAREPLAVIDVVSLLSGETETRIALPRELETPNVRVVLSGRQAIVYAHDRPLESGLVVCLEQGTAWRLGEAWNGIRQGPGTSNGDATPRLIVPRMDSGDVVHAAGETFGRVAPRAGGGFILAGASGAGGALLTALGAETSHSTPPSHRLLTAPKEWKGVVSALFWSDGTVYASSGDRMLAVDKNLELDFHEPFDLARSLRHGLNYGVNTVFATCEVAVSIPLGVGLGALVVPWSPLLFLVEPKAGALAFVAPFWFPFVRI